MPDGRSSPITHTAPAQPDIAANADSDRQLPIIYHSTWSGHCEALGTTRAEVERWLADHCGEINTRHYVDRIMAWYDGKPGAGQWYYDEWNPASWHGETEFWWRARPGPIRDLRAERAEGTAQ